MNSSDFLKQPPVLKQNFSSPSKLFNYETKQETEISTKLEHLLEYLTKNIENLKMNLEFKSFALKNDCLYIKKSLLREYQKNMTNTRVLENIKQTTGTNFEEVTNKSIIDTLQDLIDQGKIQHAFLIYLTFKSRIKVPDKTLRIWSHGYLGIKFFKISYYLICLELLRSHKLYKLANKCVKDSQVAEIKETNKVCLYFSI